MQPARWGRAVLSLLALLGAVAVWLALAPTNVGGAVTYVIVAGRSMEPGIKAGDLVLVRRADRYEVGEVVAYQNRELGRTVLHRVIDVQGGRYVLKGDANEWVDTYRPTRQDILGRMWVRVPKLGRALEWLRQPAHAAMVAGGVTGAAGMAGAGEAARRRRRRGGAVVPIAVGWWFLVLFAALTAAFGGLAAAAFTRDETRTVEEPLMFRHTGVFSYSAPVPPSPVYDGPAATTGQPVFFALARQMEVGFVYRLEAPFPHQARGRARLLARVGDPAPGGWRRTLELAPWQEFQGDEVGLSGTLDLGQVKAVVSQVEEVTGLSLSAYRLSLVPEVEVEVSAGGGAVQDTFAPGLEFRLDRLQLAMAEAGAIPGQPPADPTRPQQEGTLTVLRQEDDALSGLGVRAPVRAVRLASSVGGGVGLLGMVVTAGLMAFGLLGGAERRTRALYGHLILPVARVQAPQGPVVWVQDMEALARLAQAQGAFILHEEESGRYLVQTAGTTYVYRPEGPPPLEAPQEAEEELSALREELSALRRELGELARELGRFSPSQGGEAPSVVGLKQETQPAMGQVRREMRRRRSLWERLWEG